MSDWYGVSSSQIGGYCEGYNCCGIECLRLLEHFYNGSRFEALRVVYPSHKWAKWKFSGLSQHVWKTHRKFFDNLGSLLGLSEVSLKVEMTILRLVLGME